ncbi:hypothetical protein TNCV_4040442 [Trichonephila clavipes]|nr:hypothetical protein TNCV_4040442 [Trichonephila clavipes]
MCQLGKKLGVYRDVLKHGPIGPRASAAIGASSRSRLSPNKIVIRIVSTVKCYFRLYSPKNWEFRTRCQLDTCDDRRSCTGVGLPPYTIITPSVKRLHPGGDMKGEVLEDCTGVTRVHVPIGLLVDDKAELFYEICFTARLRVAAISEWPWSRTVHRQFVSSSPGPIEDPTCGRDDAH